MEFLVFFGAIFLLGALLLGALKVLFWLVLLPLKLSFWILKGVLGLVFLIPALLCAGFAFSGLFPFVVTVILVPVLLVVATVVALFKLAF